MFFASAIFTMVSDKAFELVEFFLIKSFGSISIFLIFSFSIVSGVTLFIPVMPPFVQVQTNLQFAS